MGARRRVGNEAVELLRPKLLKMREGDHVYFSTLALMLAEGRLALSSAAMTTLGARLVEERLLIRSTKQTFLIPLRLSPKDLSGTAVGAPETLESRVAALETTVFNLNKMLTDLQGRLL
jgi:CRP-like cAMP-binding protein